MKSPGRSPLLSFLVFCFFGGLACLFPFLPLHMRTVGLSLHQAQIISVIAPLVAIIGPLIVCPLADRLGGPQGRSLRIILAIVALLGALSYVFLLAIPTVKRLDARPPAVAFTCNSDGANILYEHCGAKCPDLEDDQIAPLILQQCHYDCVPKPHQEGLAGTDVNIDNENDTFFITTSDTPIDLTTDNTYDESTERDGPIWEADPTEPGSTDDQEHTRKRRNNIDSDNDLPHLCVQDDTNQVTCHVYTEFSGSMQLNVSLLPPSIEGEQWCQYQVDDQITCRVTRGPNCRVRCGLQKSDKIFPPPSSLCERYIGRRDLTFGTYLFVRSVAEMFPTAGLALLDTAVVVATRETNDIGKELTWGACGAAVLAPIVGILIHVLEGYGYIIPFVAFIIMMVIFALILFTVPSLPFSRPEWWAHVHPSGVLKKNGTELAFLCIILLGMGALWGALDSYLPWFIVDLEGNEFIVGLTITVGTLCAIPFLWNAEHVVEYCGYSNLLIIAFTFYIIRFTVFSFLTNAWLSLACEIMEVFTLSLMWITAVLYMRQLIPRHLTATGQGMAVVFHFCLGRSLGALVAALLSTNGSLLRVYHVGAIVAAVFASVYFIVYHIFIKGCCPPTTGANARSVGVTQGGATSNGTYTPLRVYNNTGGKKGETKGQARY